MIVSKDFHKIYDDSVLQGYKFLKGTILVLMVSLMALVVSLMASFCAVLVPTRCLG